MFEQIQKHGVDQLMALLKQFRNDTRQEKTNLVVGVYADDNGHVPILKTVKVAEERILQAEDTKNYVAIAGDTQLRSLTPPLLLGEDASAIAQQRVVCVQTPGGTAALRVAADLLNNIHKHNNVWVSTPTWANHVPVAKAAGLIPLYYPYFSPKNRNLDFTAMMNHLHKHAESGDVILLHACCHNPTGVDLSMEQWQIMSDFILKRKIFPLVDCAYQGFGKGLEEDVAGLRHMAGQVPEMLIATSFSKNFGIYRERCGSLIAITDNTKKTAGVLSVIENAIRANYSMPPSHGARIVATILNDKKLYASWLDELSSMRERVLSVRQLLQKKLVQQQVNQDVSYLTQQTGMFSYTGLTPPMVEKLRNEFAIYTAADGRINVAGISSSNVDQIAQGFASVMREYS